MPQVLGGNYCFESFGMTFSGLGSRGGAITPILVPVS